MNAVAAASVLAKVYRDEYMQEFAGYVPGYNWEVNMGYLPKSITRLFMNACMSFHHRKSFRQAAKNLQPSLWTT